MNSSKKRKGSRNNGKTKSQLQQELAQAHNTLRKQETELMAYQEELQQTRAALEPLEELQAELDSTKEQLRALWKIKEENEKLRKQLQTLEENALIQAEEAGRKLRDSENRNLELEGKIQELGKTIDSLQDKLAVSEEREETISEDIPSPKASYHIDLYPHQGHYQGRIEHLLTKDKKVFTGLDQAAIFEFISRHLPQIERGAEKTKPTPVQLKPAVEKVEEPPLEKVLEAERMPGEVRLSDLKVIPVGSDRPSTVLRHDQPFEVFITLDLTNIVLPSEGSVEQTVTIYAKPLGGGSHQIVGEARGILKSAEESSLKMEAKALPAGTYRLEASATFDLPTGAPVPFGSYLKGSLLYVS